MGLPLLIGLTFAQLWILFWIIMPPTVLFFIFYNLSLGKGVSRIFYIKRFLIIVVFILVGLMLNLPQLHYAFFQRGIPQPEEIVSSIKYSYSQAKPFNLLRLAGNAGSPMQILGYNQVSWWTLIGVIIPIVSSIPLLSKKHFSERYIQIAIMLILTIITFIWFTYLGYTYPLFFEIPLLLSLRNPKYLMLPMTFGFSILFGMGVEIVLENIAGFGKSWFQRIMKKIALMIMLIVFIVIYVYPIWDGSMGLYVRGTSYIVPQRYSDLPRLLNDLDKGESYRVLCLPYTWDTQRYLYRSVNHIGVPLGLKTSSASIVEELFRWIESGKYVGFAKALGSLNTKYVIIDKKADVSGPIKVYWYHDTPFIQGSPSYFQDFMNKQEGMIKVYEDENFVVYRNSYFLPTLYTVNVSKGFSTIFKPLGLGNLTYPSEEISNISEYTATHGRYTFKIKVSGPTFLILSESYHPSWKAYANGDVLQHHLALGWANGFLIPAAGDYEIKILFHSQNTRNLLLSTWLAAWSITVSMVIALIFRRIVFL
jgi:hypothetical protein